MSKDERNLQVKTCIEHLSTPIMELGTTMKLPGGVQLIALTLIATEVAKCLGVPLDLLLDIVKDIYENGSPVEAHAINATNMGEDLLLDIVKDIYENGSPVEAHAINATNMGEA